MAVEAGGLQLETQFDGDEDGFDPERTIYVANVVREVTREQLREFFSVIGTVTKVSIARRHSEVTAELNYAFLEFKEAIHAETARKLDGTTLRGKPVLIQPSTAPGVPALPGRSAYQAFAAMAGLPGAPMGGGPPGARFPSIGGIPPPGFGLPFPGAFPGVPAIPPPPVTGPTPFYGNNMQSPEEVARTIYVGNINETVTAEQLIDVFGVCGPTNFCRMAGDAAHPSRYAFIEFQTFEASQKAMMLNGMILVDRPLRVNKSKNPIVRPQIEKKTDAREKQARDRKLAQVVDAINRRVLGSDSRSRSPSKRGYSSGHKRSRHEESDDMPSAKRGKQD